MVDYKTDRDESAAEGYALQLRLYALALERYAGRRPDRAVLYYLRSNRIVEISLDGCRSGCRAKRSSGATTGAGSASVSVESWGAVQEVFVLGRGLSGGKGRRGSGLRLFLGCHFLLQGLP